MGAAAQGMPGMRCAASGSPKFSKSGSGWKSLLPPVFVALRSLPAYPRHYASLFSTATFGELPRTGALDILLNLIIRVRLAQDKKLVRFTLWDVCENVK
jgi:hypothetical protein